MSSEVKTGLCQDNQRPSRSLCEALEVMSYPSIRETCFECLKDIADSTTKTCSECRRSCHLQCIALQGERNTEVRKQLALLDFTCRSCQHPRKCLQCRNELGDFDTNIHSCSICLKLIHHRCHYVPPHIATLPHSYSRQIMCQHCLHHFGVREVIDRRKMEEGEFVLVVSNHLSPVHATWIPAGSLVDSFRETLEERLLLSSSYEVEVVLSMHVPTSFRGLSLQECQEMLTREEFYKIGRMSETFKFLTKWRHSYNSFIWEQAITFSQCRQHISKFLHQVRMNSISFSNVPKFITTCNMQSCIESYRVKHDVKVENAQMSDKLNYSVACQLRDEESGERIDLRNVYNLYQKQRKQYINIKSLSMKAQALLDLISNIYFLDKNPAPVAIFTDESRSSWWITNILQKTPHLSAISLQGPPTHIERLIHRFLLKQNGNEAILKFNILLVSYQCLKMVTTVLNLPQILDNLSLLVMDEKMTALARYYYSRVKIARIKFHKEIKEEKTTLLNARCQLPDEGSSSQKKFSLTLSSSNNKQFTHNHENRTQTKSNIQSSCQYFYDNFFRNGVINEKLMSEDQRLIFLRFILLFGLNCSDRSELCLRIIKFQQTVFCQNSQTVTKIEEYLSYFLAHLYTLSSNKVFNQAQEEIKRYFFFRMHPKRLFKLIARLARIKAFCELYEKNAPQLLSPIPSVMFGGTLGNKSWRSRYDYIICSKVVAYGYGKWELICRRSEQWRQEPLFTTFPQLLSEAMQTEADLKSCYEFLQMRLQEIAECMEKMAI